MPHSTALHQNYECIVIQKKKSLGRKYEIWNYVKYSCKLAKLYSLLNFCTSFQDQIAYKEFRTNAN